MYAQNALYTTPLEMSDALLIARADEGDTGAFETLVRRYRTSLLTLIQRYIKDYDKACDVLQHVFIQMYYSLAQLHATMPTTRTSTPLKSWLFRVARNRCLDELRRKRSLFFSELDIIYDDENLSPLWLIPDPNPEPEEVAENHETQRILLQAISELPPTFRNVVFLRYTRHMTFVEIGQELHIPKNTAKTYFQRARPLLKKALLTQM
ncbi:MAG TPA: RNA polymerase sigma factor [Ktedonobacteraceae bacterium]|nr:RNA polymerase sigma factor [Ktedonobacteraceae bacterium]